MNGLRMYISYNCMGFFVGFFFHHATVSRLKRQFQMKILIRLMLAFGIVEAALTVCAFDAV